MMQFSFALTIKAALLLGIKGLQHAEEELEATR